MVDESTFIQGYAKVMARTWEDPKYLDRLTHSQRRPWRSPGSR